jgi:iron complex outermembrane recepter protein
MDFSTISNRARLARTVSASALGVAMIASMSGVAQAQTNAAAASADGDEIIVSGYRKSIETSIEIKRDAVVIAEAFSSEDIGKLPDVSIAETLGRLPGLATQRLDGRSQVLSIRGLGPEFSTTLLNGREQVSSGDNRGVEYDQYPSELIDTGIVYKTPFAGLLGQGLAGTVDLRTIRPLSKKERILAVSARAEFNGGGSLNPDVSPVGYRATAAYVDKFADDTIGLALGVAYQSSPSQVERFRAWGYPSDSGLDGKTTVLGGMKPFGKSVKLDRLGLFGTLEYSPNDQLHSSVDVFYSNYKEFQPQRGIEFPLNPGWGAGTVITAASPAAGFANTVTYTGVRPVVRNDLDLKKTKSVAVGWNLNYDTDDYALDLDASYSKSDRQLSQIESYSGLGFNATSAVSDTVSYTRNADGSFSFKNTVNYADPTLIRLTDPRGWGGGDNVVQAGFLNDTATLDELKSIRGAFQKKFDSSFVKDIEIGISYSDRRKTRNIDQYYLTLAGGPTFLSQGAVTSLAIPSSALLSGGKGITFLGVSNQIAYDPQVLINNGTYKLVKVENSNLQYPGDWTVSEKVLTGWLRLDLKGNLGSVPVSGNIGVQLVRTNQSSDGFRIAPGTTSNIGAVRLPNSGGISYTNVLPSLSLNFKVSENTSIRLGAARTLARPRMDQLNASNSPSVDLNRLTISNPNSSAFSASGGNPQLKPYISDGIDLSFEHYFARRGYVSVALFHKWLSDYINPNESVLTDFSYLKPTLTAANQAILATTQGVTRGPKNSGSGTIKGVEASISFPFGMVADALEGFGLQSSASYTDSSVKYAGQTTAITVPGLSKWVVNSTVYFEKSGFEARLSHRFRSSFLAEFIGISANRDYRASRPESIFDGQIGYRFNSGTLNGLSLTAQVLNITNEPFINYQNDDERQTIDFERYGRTFMIGAAYKF